MSKLTLKNEGNASYEKRLGHYVMKFFGRLDGIFLIDLVIDIRAASLAAKPCDLNPART